MANPINRSSYASDLLPIVRKWESDQLKKHDPLTPKICTEESSDSAYEVYGVSSGMGAMQEKGEGENIQYDSNRQMYTPRFTHTAYALGAKITMEALQDAKAMKHAKRIGIQLARAEYETRDILTANLINDAFTSGVTQDGGDGSILIVTTHPSQVGNQSNAIASNADLSEASLETMFIQIRKAKDERGLRANINPVKLVIPVDLLPEAERILGSDKRVNVADNDLNYIKDSGMFPGGIVSSPYFTDTDQFVILTDVPDGLMALNRYSSGVETDNVFDSKNACFSKIIRTSRGWVNWRAVYGSPGV